MQKNYKTNFIKIKTKFYKKIETLQKTTKSTIIKLNKSIKKQKKTLLMYLITGKKYLIE